MFKISLYVTLLFSGVLFAEDFVQLFSTEKIITISARKQRDFNFNVNTGEIKSSKLVFTNGFGVLDTDNSEKASDGEKSRALKKSLGKNNPNKRKCNLLCKIKKSFYVQSAEIYLNDVKVLSHREFKNKPAVFELPVQLMGSNVLKIKLRGAWFSFAEVELYATQKDEVEDLAPVASFSASQSQAIAPASISFDASSSSDDNGIVSYNWDFGDGDFGNGVLIDHLYNTPGVYLVSLTVTDSQNQSDSIDYSVTINENQAPIVVLNSSTDSGKAPLTVDFNATGSVDPDGSIISYFWDFGDGTASDGLITSKVFEAQGTYEVLLSVTDERGAVSTATKTIEVTENVSPIAVISASSFNGFEPLPVSFSAEHSSDQDGQITSYLWKINNVLVSTEESFVYIFEAKGEYSVGLMVLDDNGSLSEEVFRTIVVQEAPLELSLNSPNEGESLRGDSFSVDFSVNKEISSYSLNGVQYSPGSVELRDFVLSLPINVTAPLRLDLEVRTASGEVAQESIIVRTETIDFVEPEPGINFENVAPQLNRSESGVGDQYEFLISGDEPIQIGVDKEAFDKSSVSLAVGKVVDSTGAELAGVEVEVLGHSYAGHVVSTSEGRYGISFNGGGYRDIRLSKEGYFPVDRKIYVERNAPVSIPDVALTLISAVSKNITMNSVASQSFVGETVEDEAGIRTPRMFIPTGSQAVIETKDGLQSELSNFNLRVTEYTVGELGPMRMPADLASNTAYTYAAEFSIDETISNPSLSVKFSSPIYYYLDNYLNFPVGSAVPGGTYDRNQRAWIARPDGIVIGVLRNDESSLELDLNGDGIFDLPGSIPVLNISDDELDFIKNTYVEGSSFWRIPVSHFSPQDYNALGDQFPFYWLPKVDSSVIAHEPSPNRIGPSCSDRQNTHGSIVDMYSRHFVEWIDLPSGNGQLSYSSKRSPGYNGKYQVRVPVITNELYDSNALDILRVDISVNIGGRVYEQSFSNQPGQYFNIEWDGKDFAGRFLGKEVNAYVKSRYVMQDRYVVPNFMWTSQVVDDGNATTVSNFTSFGRTLPSNNGLSFPSVTRAGTGSGEMFLEAENTYKLGVDIPVYSNGVAGNWTYSSYHTFNPDTYTLHLGNGKEYDLDKRMSVRFLLGAVNDYSYNKAAIGVVYPSRLTRLGALALTRGQDGNFYFINDNRLYKITRDFNAVGIKDLSINTPSDLKAGPDGKLYILSPYRIWSYDLETEELKVYAGTGVNGSSGDNGPAINAKFVANDGFVISEKGNIYFKDRPSRTIRKIGTDGIIVRYAGSGSSGTPASDLNHNAFDVPIHLVSKLAVDDDENLYFMLSGQLVVLEPSGIMRTLIKDDRFSFPSGNYLIGVNKKDEIFMVNLEARNGGLYKLNLIKKSVQKITSDLVSILPDYFEDGDPLEFFTGGNTKMEVIDDEILFSGYVGIQGLNGSKLASFLVSHGYQNGDGFEVPSPYSEEKFQFDRNGNHVSTTDSKFDSINYIFARDEDGRLSNITDKYGNETSFSYSGEDLSIQFPNLRYPLSFSVGNNGDLIEADLGNGEIYSFSYDSSGRLKTFTNPLGGEKEYSYDSQGFLSREENELGGFLSLINQRNIGDSSYQENQEIKINRSTYNVQDIDYTLTLDGSTVSTVSVGGEALMETVAREGQSLVSYSNGSVIESSFNASIDHGILKADVSSRNITTPEGLISQTASFSRVSLSGGGDLRGRYKFSSINGKEYYSYLDRSTNITSFGLPSGKQSYLSYNELGDPSSVWQEDVAPITWEYNQDGTIYAVAQADRRWVYGYNNLQLSSITDPMGNVKNLVRNSKGEIIEQNINGKRKLLFEYDDSGRLEKLTNPMAGVYVMLSNVSKLLESFEAPIINGNSQNIESFGYSIDKQLNSFTKPNGSSLGYIYNDIGKLQNVTENSVVLKTYVRDRSTDQLTGINSASGINHSFSYDGFLLKSEMVSGELSGSYQLNYDNDFRLSSDQVSSGDLISYTYDDDSLLSSAGSSTYIYKSSNTQLESVNLGSLKTEMTYNQYGELETLSVTNTTTAQEIYSYSLTRDLLGRISVKDESISGISTQYIYDYDEFSQLKSVSKDSALISQFDYDANGNRTLNNTEVTSYDIQDRVIASNGITYEFNSNGQLTSLGSVPSNKTFEYDALGMLKKVVLPTSDIIEYVNDARDRRSVIKKNGIVQKAFIYQDQLNPVAELDGSGNIISRFVYGSKINVPEYMIKGGIEYKIISDHLGSVRLVVNASNGNILQRMDYDTWGKVTNDTNPGFQPFGFAGGIYDQDTKLVKFGARDYDPEIGRWISKDPIRFSGGINLYAYTGNDPVNYIDPLGLARCKYSIGTGRLSCTSNDGVITAGANMFSGNDNPQLTQYIGGPIPRGTYRIRNIPGSNPSDWFLDPGIFSRIGYRLGLNRGGFNLHLRKGASSGCITGTKGESDANFNSINDLLNQESGDNTLEVGF